MTDIPLVPVAKDKMKNPSDSKNYRPVALASDASKIFEKLILARLSAHLYTSDHQFGVKNVHSTEMCVHALKEVIDYYQQLNTPVSVCFLDLKCAFDRVSYNELFCKLLERNVPLYLVKLLQMWYTLQNLFVGWGKFSSKGFKMTNGMRQGYLISPYLFNVYMDELNRSWASNK